jgi:hypothetical protein
MTQRATKPRAFDYADAHAIFDAERERRLNAPPVIDTADDWAQAAWEAQQLADDSHARDMDESGGRYGRES